MSAALEVRNLNVYYGQIHALRDVSIDAEVGKITTLLGANGAGKTTLLRTISGLLSPRSGHVRIAGEDIAGIEPHLIVRRGVSQSPEGRQVFPNLTVLENLQLGAYSRTDKAGVQALAKLPGLNELRATILSMINQPATKLVRTINEPGSALARVIKAKSEKA